MIVYTKTDRVPVKAWTEGVPVEPEALEQVFTLASMPFIYKHVALMADVHVGIGSTVGSVIATKGAIIPASVGVDIGCVDAESEFLSPCGWKKISAYAGEAVMQYEPTTGEGRFVQPLAYVKRPSAGFFHFHTKYGINQKLSRDHKVLGWRIVGRDRRREMFVTTAGGLAEEHDRLVLGAKFEFETSFKPALATALTISEPALCVQVAVMADGHILNYETGNTVVKLRKERKITRLRLLLATAMISFTERVDSRRDHTFRFTAPKATKTYADFWGASLEQLEIIAEECLHWDGNLKDRVFFTRDKASADFIQYAFSATGKRAVMRQDEDHGALDYRVFATENTKTGLGGSPKSRINFESSEDGFEYCFTVPSSFWVMRRGGNVVMTGNCGMVAQRLSLKASDLPDNLFTIRSAIEAAVPHGRTDNGGANDRGAWGSPDKWLYEAYGAALNRPDELFARHPKAWPQKDPVDQLSTLGTGNHFIELCLDEEDFVWIMLHSGSRGLGNRIGSYFIELAKKDMERWFINLPNKDLAYLPEGSEHYEDYIAAVEFAQGYAMLNRQLMLSQVTNVLLKSYPALRYADTAINCHHNYVAKEHHYGQNVLVTRKGAVRARIGDFGIIPGSMGTHSYIVRGKGNRESFTSCSHGAGRRMSRTAARQQFTLADHALATAGVECRQDTEVLDETPGAYKDIESVMAAQTDLVDIVHTLKQVLCIKG